MNHQVRQSSARAVLMVLINRFYITTESLELVHDSSKFRKQACLRVSIVQST